MKDRTLLTIAAMSWIGIIELACISCGVDGTVLVLSIASICGLGGYVAGTQHKVGEK